MICRRAIQALCTLFALAALGSCATQQYAYLPAGVSGQNGSRAQRGKAFYQVPAEAPAGNVRVMSAGIMDLTPNGGGPKIHALHLRMVVSNQSGQAAWSVDPRAQSVSFLNDGTRISPVYFEPAAQPSPALVINPGEIKALDLYFKLPESQESAKDVPEFDFRWRVQAGTELVEESTSFDRVPVESYAYGPYPYWEPGWGVAWGPGYWGPGSWGPPVVFQPGGAPSRPVIVGH